MAIFSAVLLGAIALVVLHVRREHPELESTASENSAKTRQNHLADR